MLTMNGIAKHKYADIQILNRYFVKLKNNQNYFLTWNISLGDAKLFCIVLDLYLT